MFRRVEYKLNADPVCTIPTEIDDSDFRYYDKDGFELNKAEQKYYSASGHILHDCLNHICWQDQWLELNHPELTLDHCLILTRASYSGKALEQLEKHRPKNPSASYLIHTKQKWGFDLALDALDCHGNVFEVIHIEYDNRNFEEFFNRLASLEKIIYNIDWLSAARKIEKAKDKWIGLKGFEQNHWKANYIIGWDKAEYTDKTT